jgi:hypothetical protein
MTMPSKLQSTGDYEAFLENDLLTWLREQETDRRSAFRQAARRAAPMVLTALAVLVLALAYRTPLLTLAAILVVPVCVVWALFRFAPFLFWGERFEKAFFARVFEYFGLCVVDPPPTGFLDQFSFLALLPGGRTYEICCHAQGEFHGVACDIALGRHATSNRGAFGSRSLRDGSLFVRLAYPKPFEGVTSVVPDYGAAVNFVRPRPHAEDASVARVRLENPDFEAVFEVYSTDQVEARYLLTPRVMERVMALAKRFGSEVRLAFARGQFYLVIEGESPYFTEGVEVDDRCVLAGLYALGADVMRASDVVEAMKLDAETRV